MTNTLFGRLALVGLTAAGLVAAFAGPVGAQSTPGAQPSTTPGSQSAAQSGSKPTILLVHGAWADGSSWARVIPLLQNKGYTVVAVQNPLTSLADDVAATNRAIDLQTGPIVLVGHSWGGAVITQAGNSPKVAALVYVAAFAPDSGQSINDLQAGLPPPPWASQLIKDNSGFLTLPAQVMAQDFAQDLPASEQRVLAATQAPWFGGSQSEKVTQAAWRDKPSWWVLSENDRMIPPSLQATMAANIKATVTKVRTSHVAMLADPKAVANVIIAAANHVESGGNPAAGR